MTNQLLSALEGVPTQVRSFLTFLFFVIIMKVETKEPRNISFFPSGSVSTWKMGCSTDGPKPDGCQGVSVSSVKAEKCYCSTDLCNTASRQQLGFKVIIFTFVMLQIVKI